MARRMGLREEEIRVVEDAALLHDVGKAATPDPVLEKRGPLDERERRLMQEHVEVGVRMVASVEGLDHLAPLVSGLRTSAGTGGVTLMGSRARRFRSRAAPSTPATPGTP